MSISLLVPKDKYDTESVNALAAAPWESIAPVMPQILEWMQDINWPVARALQPFLARVGLPLLPFVRSVFATDDEAWKYNVLVSIVDISPELVAALRPDLERMANAPTTAELVEGVSDAAREILAK